MGADGGAGGSLVFRSDIEGLRGLAVTVVVLAHAGLPGVQGGFVGVDVFFVLSGFLITGLLKAELEQTGRIRFVAFYARRARRLLPALVSMLLVTMAAAILLLHPAGWKMQAESMGWAAAWMSNLYFSFAEFSYFGAGATDSLYLHTWSLGVEEQFYLVWPALLGLLWFVAGTRALRSGVLLVVLVGCAAAMAASAISPVQAYYQTPFRIWQLAAGGLIHFVVQARPIDLPWSAAVRATGLALLGSACFWLAPSRVAYPGVWSLLPTAGALLLLVPARAGPHDCLLDNPVLRFLGRLSYSWYLWHWPVMVIAYDRFGQHVMVGLAAGVLALIPAWLSWRWVERNTSRHINSPGHWVVSGLLVSTVLAALALFWWTRAPVAVEPVEQQERQALATLSMPALYADPACDEWYSSARVVPCMRVRAQDQGSPVVVLVGDSVGAQWAPAFENIAREKGWTFVVLTKSSCPMLDRSYYYPRIRRRFTECEEWRRGVVDYLRQTGPSLVVIGSTAGYGDAFSEYDWETGTRDFVLQLLTATGSVGVMAPSPLLPFDAVDCISSHGRRRFPACSVSLEALPGADVARSVARAVEGVRGASMLDMTDVICPAGVCTALSNGVLTYRDSQHLNAAFVESLSEELARRMAASGILPAGPDKGLAGSPATGR